VAENSPAIIGAGWVGKSMMELFPEAVVYDEPLLNKANRQHGEKYQQMRLEAGRAAVNACDVAFVCVPTPNLEDGSLDTSIVEEVVDWCESDLIVIRSTVMPGTADRLKAKTGKRIVTQPEYLGETVAHPLLDQGERPFMILGGDPKDRRQTIELYQGVYNANINIRQVTNKEAEVIKLSENRAIMYKVAQCQELYDACEAADIDYYTVRDAVYGDDPRFNLWHTFVFPDARGANSKCIPKDTLAWAAWAESVGADTQIMQAIHKRNSELVNGINSNPQS
jgi:UDPglucose 6-dehydrogenase